MTKRPFSDELPGLLAERGLSLRVVAREVGGFDHGYLSRMLSGKVAPNPQHVARISDYLGLPDDYFPEVREARTVDAIRQDAELRDRTYSRWVRRRR